MSKFFAGASIALGLVTLLVACIGWPAAIGFAAGTLLYRSKR